MARDSPVRDGGSDSNRRGFDRRSMLKLTGAVAGSAVAASTVSASEDYEVIEARGQTIQIGDGETLENVLFDMTTGQGVTIVTRHSTDWTIRNVGFHGYNEGSGFRMGLSDAGGGNSLVENLYLGDGSAKVGDFVHGPGAIFLGPEHDGHITFRHCNVQGYPNNGFYCSNASPGTVRFEHCLAKNNGVANFRTDHGEIHNCVAYNDNTSYGWDGGYSEENGRPTWFWASGPVDIYDSNLSGQNWTRNRVLIAGANNSPSTVRMHSGAIEGNVHEANGSSITVDSSVGSSPDLSVPEGCPTSAAEAASGGGSSGSGGSGGDDGDESDDDWDRRFVYELVGDGEPTDYYLEVEGAPLERSTFNDATIDEEFTWISDDGTRAAGRVVDGRHAWEFDELLLDVTVEGGADALVDERESNLDRYPQPGATGDDWKGDMPWHEDDYRFVYELVAEGEDEPTDYYIEVEDGPIVPSEFNGATIEDEYMWVSDDGTRVAGRVVDGRHAWEFDELLTDVTVDGPADALVDERPSNLGRYPQPGATGDDWKGDMPWHDDHVLVIDGVGQAGSSDYTLQVSGDLGFSDADGAFPDEGDEIDGSQASGTVAGWRDAYRFTGDLEAITVDGSATVRLDGEQIDPDDYGTPGSQLLTVIGGVNGAEYEIVVDGSVTAVGYDPGNPSVDGDTISGSLERSFQRFRLEGSLESVSVDGSGWVYLDGDAIDPADY